jgi:hypothetical protein
MEMMLRNGVLAMYYEPEHSTWTSSGLVTQSMKWKGAEVEDKG